VDRDQMISSCALFWDDGKFIAKSSGVAAYLDPGLIPKQWPDGRDYEPVLGRSKLHSESCDKPGSYCRMLNFGRSEQEHEYSEQ